MTGTFNKIGTKIAAGSTDGNVYIFAITPSFNTPESTPAPPTPSIPADGPSNVPLPSAPSSFPIPTLLARLPAHSVDLADKRRRKKEIGIKEVKFSRYGDKVLTGCMDGTAIVHWFETVDEKGEWKSRRLIIEEPTSRRASVAPHMSLARRNLMAGGAGSDVEDSAGEGEGAGGSAGSSQNSMTVEALGTGSQAVVDGASLAMAEQGTGGGTGTDSGTVDGGQVFNGVQVQGQPAGVPAVLENGAQNGEEQKVGITQLAWSLDDALVITIMLDGLIRVWDAKSFELLHTLSGHTSSEVYTLDVHPLDPRIIMTAGYDGKMFIWDIALGVELKRFEFGERALLSGSFSPDGSQIVLVDINGCAHLYGLSVEQPSPYKSSPYEQFFDLDWSIVRQDQDGNLLDEQAQIAPELVDLGSVVDMSRSPYPAYGKWQKQLPLEGMPLWEGWTRKVREERLGRVREEMGVLEMETKSANPNLIFETPKTTPKKRRRVVSESEGEPDYQIFQDDSFVVPLPESSGDEYAGNNASASEDEVPSEPGELEVASDDPNFIVDDDGEGGERRLKRRKKAGRPKKKLKRRTKTRNSGNSSGKRKRRGDADEEDDLEWDMVSDGSAGGRKKRKRVVNYAEMDPDLESSEGDGGPRRRSSRTDKEESDLTGTESESDVDVVMSSSPSPPPKNRKGKGTSGPSGGAGGGGSGRAGAKSWFRNIGFGGPFVPRSVPGEWITQTQPKRTPYLPQIGDFVAYIKKGHRQFLEVAQREYSHLNIPLAGPGGLDPRMPGVVYGEVRKISFLATNPEVACVEIDVWVEHGGEMTWGTANRNGYEFSAKPPYAPVKVRMHPLKINDRKEVLRVAWADVEECTDFLVLFEDFVWGCFERELVHGQRVEVEYADGEYPGVVESFSDGGGVEEGWDGGWESVEVSFDTGGSDKFSPWEVRRAGEGWRVREGLGDTEIARLEVILQRYVNDESLNVFVEPVDYAFFTTYLQSIAYPVCFNSILKRLRNGFYRSVQAVAWDVDIMAANAKQFNEEGSDIWSLANDVLSVLRDDILGPVKAKGKRSSEQGQASAGGSASGSANGSASGGESGLKVKLKLLVKGFGAEAGGGGGASTGGTVEEYSEAGDEDNEDGDVDEDDRWERKAQGRGRRRRGRIISDDDEDAEERDVNVEKVYPAPEMYENGVLLPGSEADGVGEDVDLAYDEHSFGSGMDGLAGNEYGYAPHYTVEDANVLASPDIFDNMEEGDELDAEGSEVEDEELWQGTGYGGMSNGVGAGVYGDGTPSREMRPRDKLGGWMRRKRR